MTGTRVRRPPVVPVPSGFNLPSRAAGPTLPALWKPDIGKNHELANHRDQHQLVVFPQAAWRFSSVPNPGIQHIMATAVMKPMPAIEVKISYTLRDSVSLWTRA